MNSRSASSPYLADMIKVRIRIDAYIYVYSWSEILPCITHVFYAFEHHDSLSLSLLPTVYVHFPKSLTTSMCLHVRVGIGRTKMSKHPPWVSCFPCFLVLPIYYIYHNKLSKAHCSPKYKAVTLLFLLARFFFFLLYAPPLTSF